MMFNNSLTAWNQGGILDKFQVSHTCLWFFQPLLWSVENYSTYSNTHFSTCIRFLRLRFIYCIGEKLRPIIFSGTYFQLDVFGLCSCFLEFQNVKVGMDVGDYIVESFAQHRNPLGELSQKKLFGTSLTKESPILPKLRQLVSLVEHC